MLIEFFFLHFLVVAFYVSYLDSFIIETRTGILYSIVMSTK